MTELLVKAFVKDKDNIGSSAVRTSYGVLAGVVGIVCNLLLGIIKLLTGLLINSVAVMADAFNNMSDAVSSVISLLGVKLAGRPADKEHPFGHGRYEYVAALAVAFIVLQVALSSFKSSFDKILNPEDVSFSVLPVVILSVSMCLKLWLSFFNRKLGKRIESNVMKAASVDALGDVGVTGATVVSLLTAHFFGLNIDGYVGCAVSVMVFIAGINIARDTIEPLLGQAAGREVYRQITDKVMSYEGIMGTHDLIVHSYGPTRTMATIHAEVRNDANLEETHETIDRIERDILHEMNIFLVIHMDPIEVRDESVVEKKKCMRELVKALEPKAEIHDFRVVNGANQINLIFDLVLPFGYKKETELLEGILKGAREQDIRYQCVITVENSYVEEDSYE